MDLTTQNRVLMSEEKGFVPADLLFGPVLDLVAAEFGH